MKSNELFEKIHRGEIQEGTKIKVKTEDGIHIAFIDYQEGRLNWIPGEFSTRYLCDIETEFEIVRPDGVIEKLDLEKKIYVGERITLLEKKVNEIITEINKINETLSPFRG